MSRSPENAQPVPSAMRSYEDSWEAIYNLIDEGSSWSGHERNCCFLNTRTSAFATVSAATGLDFPDDGRAVATTDWDFDGRLDFWVTNRTAPRLRFLHNASRGQQHFVVFLLQGKTSNRDAIGARVEVTPAAGPPLIRTLHAGDGYLAQSGKAVHFGLGSDAGLRKVVVRWPGGAAETFDGVTADTRWTLVQGTGRAVPAPPPRGELALPPGALEVPQRPAATRTWIAGRVPFPIDRFTAWDGSEKPLASFAGQPLLINLWSESCAPCLAELAEWKGQATALGAAGLAVLALCVDEDAAERTAAKTRAAGLPFASGLATPAMARAFETVSRAFLESRRPLPVPSSVLLDERGHVAALYKGRLTASGALADVALLKASAEAQRAASLPFPGRWMTPPLTANPRQIIGTFMKAGDANAARAYTLRCLDPASRFPLPPGTIASLTLFLGDLELDAGDLDAAVALYSRLFDLAGNEAGIHREAAIRLVTKQRVTEALQHLEKAVALAPDHADSRLNLASLLLRDGKTESALSHFRELARQVPGSAPLQTQIARILLSQGRAREAIAHYQTAHRLSPGSAATNDLAWILATHRDAAVRDGPQAVALAELACRGQGATDPLRLDTLAAAYAEAGRFDDAIAVSERALSRAAAAGQPAVVDRLTRHLERLRSRSPLRD